MLMRYGILFLLLISARTMAQDEHTCICAEVKIADSLLAQNDTAAALHHFEDVDRLYPIEGLSSGACLKIGKIYLAQGRRQDAARIWRKGLITSSRASCPYEVSIADHYYQYSLAKPNIAFQLSELFKDSHDSMYKYTLWADTVYCTPFNCGNAWEDYHALISPRVAMMYLERGDTTKALDRLCMSLLFNVGVAKKLKPLLLLRYDQKTINRELRKCMYHPQKLHDKDDHISYSIFGYEILFTYDEDRKGTRVYMRRNKSIVFLKAPVS